MFLQLNDFELLGNNYGPIPTRPTTLISPPVDAAATKKDRDNLLTIRAMVQRDELSPSIIVSYCSSRPLQSKDESGPSRRTGRATTKKFEQANTVHGESHGKADIGEKGLDFSSQCQRVPSKDQRKVMHRDKQCKDHLHA